MIKKRQNVSEEEAFEKACKQNGIEFTDKKIKGKGYIDYVNSKDEVIRVRKGRKPRKLIIATIIRKLKVK